jgi:hypothetical protein
MQIDLDKDLIVIGNVVGSHTVRDISVTIKYGESVRLNSKQVSKSIDLIHDIESKKLRIDSRLYKSNLSMKKQHNIKDDKVSKVVDIGFNDLKNSVQNNTQALSDMSKIIQDLVLEMKSMHSESLREIPSPNIWNGLLSKVSEIISELGDIKVSISNMDNIAIGNDISLDDSRFEDLKSLLKKEISSIKFSSISTNELSNGYTGFVPDVYIPSKLTGSVEVVDTKITTESVKSDGSKMRDNLRALKALKDDK